VLFFSKKELAEARGPLVLYVCIPNEYLLNKQTCLEDREASCGGRRLLLNKIKNSEIFCNRCKYFISRLTTPINQPTNQTFNTHTNA
jgi:hypothetical protein